MQPFQSRRHKTLLAYVLIVGPFYLSALDIPFAVLLGMVLCGSVLLLCSLPWTG